MDRGEKMDDRKIQSGVIEVDVNKEIQDADDEMKEQIKAEVRLIINDEVMKMHNWIEKRLIKLQENVAD